MNVRSAVQRRRLDMAAVQMMDATITAPERANIAVTWINVPVQLGSRDETF